MWLLIKSWKKYMTDALIKVLGFFFYRRSLKASRETFAAKAQARNTYEECRLHLRDVIHTTFNVQSRAGSVDPRVDLANWLMAYALAFQDGVDFLCGRGVNDLTSMDISDAVRMRASRCITERDTAGIDALATEIFSDFLRHPGGINKSHSSLCPPGPIEVMCNAQGFSVQLVPHRQAQQPPSCSAEARCPVNMLSECAKREWVVAGGSSLSPTNAPDSKIDSAKRYENH